MANIFDEAEDLNRREDVILEVELHPYTMEMRVLRLEGREPLPTIYLSRQVVGPLAQWLGHPSSHIFRLGEDVLLRYGTGPTLELVLGGRNNDPQSFWVGLFQIQESIETLLDLLG